MPNLINPTTSRARHGGRPERPAMIEEAVYNEDGQLLIVHGLCEPRAIDFPRFRGTARHSGEPANRRASPAGDARRPCTLRQLSFSERSA